MQRIPKLTQILLPIIIFSLLVLFNPHEINAATYTVINGNDSGIGSLRAAIANSEISAGTDTIEFAIPTTDSSYNSSKGWFRIQLLSELPVITEPISILGGTQGQNIGNTNPGQIGTGGYVGVDNLELSRVEKPEILITPNLSTNLTRGFFLSGSGASGSVIEGISMYGFGPIAGSTDSGNGAIVVIGVSNLTIQKNILGTDPDDISSAGDMSNLAPLLGINDDIRGSLIKNNFFGFSAYPGLFYYDEVIDLSYAVDFDVISNEFTEIGLFSGAINAIEINNHVVGDVNIDLVGNLFYNNYGREQVDLVATNNGLISNSTISNNSIINSGTLSGIVGIRLREVQNSLFSKNIIKNNNGAGILVSSLTASPSFPNGSYGNKISQNQFMGNSGLSIDLCKDCASTNLGDGITLNDGLFDIYRGNNGIDFPLFSSATLVNGGILQVKGTAVPDSTVEVYRSIADTNGSDTLSGFDYGEGVEYLGTVMVDLSGNFTGNIDVSETNLDASSMIGGIVIDDSNNTSEFGQNIEIETLTSQIGISKEYVLNSYLGDNRYSISFLFVLENLGLTDVTNIQIEDDLDAVFGSNAQWRIVELTSSTLNVNDNYNGISDYNILEGNESFSIGQTAVIELKLEVTPVNTEFRFSNSAVVRSSVLGDVDIIDYSDNGNDVDSDGDLNPNEDGENDPTQFSFEASLSNTGSNLVLILIVSCLSLLVLLGILIKNRCKLI
jgi:hypothetical protein